MKFVFIIWVFAVAILSIWLYRATHFEYIQVDRILEIKLVWAGLFSIPKRIPLSDIESVHRLKSLREALPLVGGTFPSLWGKFRPSKMLILSRKGKKFLPIIIAPDNPEEFVNRISPLLRSSYPNLS